MKSKGGEMLSLIQLEHIGKTYQSGENAVEALLDITLTFDRGEMAAIVGQSGSGKSTLMNILGTLDVADKGHYYLDGRDVKTLNEKELNHIRGSLIGFIFQKFNLIPNLTAFENVTLPLLYRGIGKEKREQMANTALERVGLTSRTNHLPGQLSGGQQQRVAIARAIASRPPILLADEPTGNLDSKAGHEILDILKELHQEGHTVLIITHDNSIAAQMPRLVKICDGRIVT